MQLVSLRVGPAAIRTTASGPLTTALGKCAVAGPLELSAEGLAGDEQADRKNHGGPEKAVLGYAAAHYSAWQTELTSGGRPCRLGFGAFGENFTLAGATEATVRIGDIWRAGSARLEIAQPRIPCRTPARYWEIADLDARMRRSGRTGWYFRVLEAGEVRAGEEMQLLARPFPALSVARANELFHGSGEADASAAEDAARFAACPALASGWRRRLATKFGTPGSF